MSGSVRFFDKRQFKFANRRFSSKIKKTENKTQQTKMCKWRKKELILNLNRKPEFESFHSFRKIREIGGEKNYLLLKCTYLWNMPSQILNIGALCLNPPFSCKTKSNWLVFLRFCTCTYLYLAIQCVKKVEVW
jgi:hypothetical protein